MKQILVPTDFSESADNAIDFAIQSSKILPAKVTLLHSYEVNSSLYTDYMGVNKEFTSSLLNDADKNLAELSERISETQNVKADTLLSIESLQEAIAKTVKDKGIDLIVMGTLGASGLREKIWGSTTAAVITNTKIPVMAIPIEYHWQKPKKILFTTNRFEKESGILNYLFELAGMYMARVQVAVFTDEDDDKAATFIENKSKIAEYESFLKENYQEETLSSAHLYGEQFEDTLQNFIKENEIDMLVMVTYQNKFWNRIFNPSKTRRMSYQTKIPLLAIPAAMGSGK